MREILQIFCSCTHKQPSDFINIKSTVSTETKCTETENNILGCAIPDCCLSAYQCSVCSTRFTFQLVAPECD
jgi:hypothetical protein